MCPMLKGAFILFKKYTPVNLLLIQDSKEKRINHKELHKLICPSKMSTEQVPTLIP